MQNYTHFKGSEVVDIAIFYFLFAVFGLLAMHLQKGKA